MELRHTVACKKCGKSLISCQAYEDTEKIIDNQKSSCCNAPYNYIGLQVVQNEILNYSKKKDGILEVNSVDSKRNRASKVIAIEDLKNKAEEPKRRGRPARQETQVVQETTVAEAPKKRGRPKADHTPVIQVQEHVDETPKRRGRPPKALDTPVVQVTVAEEPKRRGRPKNTTNLADIDKIVEQEIQNEVPKRRGRPKAEPTPVVQATVAEEPKRRGRPPKALPTAQVEEPVEHITVKRGRRQAG